MDITQKSLNKVFAYGVLGLYTFGFGATLGIRSAEYTRTIGDYKRIPLKNVEVLRVDANTLTNFVDGYISFPQPTINASYVHNNVLQNISPVVTALEYYEGAEDDPLIYGYNVFLWGGASSDVHYLNFVTTDGTLPLTITYEGLNEGAFWTYHFSVEYNSSATYLSNLYIDNLQLIDDDNSEHIFAHLPTIFFTGESDIMRNELIFETNQQISSNIDISFDLKIMPPSMIDTITAFNEGYDKGYGYGYNDGKTYVIGHADEFNLYTYQQYILYGQQKYNQGRDDYTNVLSMSGVMNTIFTAPISMFMQVFNSGAFRWTMPTGEVLDLGGLMTFFLTIGIALAIVRLIMKVGGK